MANMWVVDGRPRGGADFPPELFFGGESVQVRGGARGRGEGGAVEPGEDVGLDDVLVDV